MSALGYEHFVLKAFELKMLESDTTPKTLMRSGDPAMSANADYYSDGNITMVIIGTSYAMSIFVSILQNDPEIHLSNEEAKRLDDYLAKILKSKTVTTVTKCIEEFKEFYNIFKPDCFRYTQDY